MNPTSLPNKPPVRWRGTPLLLLVLAGALVAALFLFQPAKSNDTATAYYEVRRGDFTVSVIESGTLAAVSEVSIRNEVEGTARIISIVPEGSYVKKGDLLVELDSAQAQDQVNQQTINYEKAKFAVEQAQATLDIQKSATNSDYLAADLKVRFAKIDREKYERGQLKVDMVEASNKIVQAIAVLSINLDSYMNSTNLAAKGYETRQKVDTDRLAVLNNRNSLIVASNGLWMLEQFDIPKAHAKYDADVQQAEQELERVVSQNRRKMLQYEADLSAQSNTLVLSEQKLARDRKNLNATRISAPQDGLVVFQVSENRFSSESLIEGGAVVRNRQELIKLPDLSRMKVTVKVHESHVNMIRPGLPAFVILDSQPDERYRAVVEKVAPLPDTQARWGNPNLKVYNTEVHLTDALSNVKPGVSAKAEIVVTNIANALSVPIQAVTTFKGNQVVYAVNGGKSEPRRVEVGMFNTKFIEITKGVNVGDRVLLSPPFDTQAKDLEGAVLADDEKARFASTNVAQQRRPAPQGAPSAGPRETAEAGGDGGPPGRGAEGGRGGGDRTARRGGFNPEEFMKQFDKNGDGQLDESEREAMRAAMAARFGGAGGRGGPGLDREEMLKRFDKNGDGVLDESERAAMREAFPGGGRTNRVDRGQGGEARSRRSPRGETGNAGEGERAAGSPTPAPQP
jgi:HlyD family secretion protein